MAPRSPTPPQAMKMFVGGFVYQQEVGNVLAVLFKAHAERVDCQPVLEEPEPSPLPGTKHEVVKLPAPKNGHAPRGLLIKMVEAAMQKNSGPISVAELREKLIAEGFPGGNPNISSALDNLRRQKKAVRTKDGLYVLKEAKAKTTAAKPTTGRLPEDGTAGAAILGLLRKATQPLNIGDIAKKLEPQGHASGAVNMAMRHLITRGFASRVSPGLYAAANKGD